MGLPCDKAELRELVGAYVKAKQLQTPFKDGIPGEDWYYGFMRRHPALSLKKPEHLQKLRKDARRPEIVYNFFEQLKKVVTESNLDSEGKSSFVFNADESGFNSDPNRVRGIGTKGKALCRISGGSGRESTTVLACVSADGKALPPLIIFKGAAVQARWTSNAAYPGTLYGTSKNGWMEEPQFFQWFTNGFVPHVKELRTAKNLPQQTAILIYDGHCSHISVRLIEEALKSNIELIKFPSHLTDKLQPLDKCVFGPLKSCWNRQLVKYGREQMGQGCGRLPKNKFVELLGTTWQESMKSRNIISGFLTTGVYPVDPTRFPRDEFNINDLEKYEEFCNISQQQTQGIHLITARSDTLHSSSVMADTQASQQSTILNNNPSTSHTPQPSTSFIPQLSPSSTSKSSTSIVPQMPTETTVTDIFIRKIASTSKSTVTPPKVVIPRLKPQSYGEVLTTKEVLTRLKEAEERRNKPTKKRKQESTVKQRNLPGKENRNKQNAFNPKRCQRMPKEQSDTSTDENEIVCLSESDSPCEEDIIILKNVDLPDLSQGKFIVVQFKGGKRGTTIFKCLCVIEEVDIINEKIKVAGLKSCDDSKMLFHVVDNDVHYINMQQIVGLLPNPGIQLKGDRIFYKFNAEVPINEQY